MVAIRALSLPHFSTSPSLMNVDHTNTVENIPSKQQTDTFWLPSTFTRDPYHSTKVPTPKSITYFYNSKTNKLLSTQDFDRMTVAVTSASARPSTPDLGYYSSPASTPNTSPKPHSSKMARTVQFGAPEGVREPLSDEKNVMKTFNKHVKNCDECYNSLSSWERGRPLCSKGHSYVIDIQPYVYIKGKKPYSLIDLENKNEVTRILVSADYTYVSRLFEALSAGYSTKPKPRKVVVHQSAPRVRTPSPRRERPTVVIPAERYHTIRSADRYHDDRRYREPKYRGSLYHDDERRRTRYDAEIVYATPTRYHY